MKAYDCIPAVNAWQVGIVIPLQQEVTVSQWKNRLKSRLSAITILVIPSSIIILIILIINNAVLMFDIHYHGIINL